MVRNTDTIKEITCLMKAKAPCIWLQTYEEEAAIRDICDMLNNEFNDMTPWVWSGTEGLRRLPLNPSLKEEPPIKGTTPFDAVLKAMKKKQDDATSSNLWILRDFHKFVNEWKAQRLIRDAKEWKAQRVETEDGRFRSYYNPILVVSPVCDIPDDIAKLFHVVEYSLPEADYISGLVKHANEKLQQAAANKPEAGIKSVSDEEVETITNACIGLTAKEIVMALRESSVKYHTLNLDFMARNKIQMVKKSGVLDYRIPKVSFDDIGGNDAVKKWLLEEKEAFSPEARSFGIDLPKGIMAVGVAGCGKTLIAEAFANEMHVPLISFTLSKIMDKLVGQSEQKVAYALQIVRACAPCVLLIDEVEKLLGGVDSRSDGGVTARILAALLKFMQDNDNGVYVIMTSNNVSQLPPEFTRAGRLDATWYFGLPSDEERKAIFKVHFGHRGREVGDVILHAAVKASQGFTGAEIEQVVKNAMRKAYVRYKKDGNDSVTKDDVIEAASEVIPVSQSSREKILALDKYCETRARNASGEKKKITKKTSSEDDLLLDF